MVQQLNSPCISSASQDHSVSWPKFCRHLYRGSHGFLFLTEEITILWIFFFRVCSGWQNWGYKMLISNLTPWQQSQPSQGWNKESNLISREMSFSSVAGRLPWRLTVIPLDSAGWSSLGTGSHSVRSSQLQAFVHNLKLYEKWRVFIWTTSCNFTAVTFTQRLTH